MSHFWLISVPACSSKQNAFLNLKDKIASANAEYADVAPFPIPDLKIGTLDQLVTLSDDLIKIDASIEATVLKVVDIMKTLLRGDLEQLRANLSVGDRSVEHYLRNFQWNTMKYRVDKPLREITESLQQEVGNIDAIMKTKLSAYNQVKSNLSSLERKQTGNLSVRSLADIVKKEHFLLDSEFLCTQLVAVPKQLYKQWFASYETLTDKVVPRSAVKIAEDDDYGLFAVIIFQKVLEEFCNKAREMKYIPRDFKYNESELKTYEKEMQDLGTQEKELWGTLLRLCKTNFGEALATWMHIKAIKVFVESILRYGLPPEFMSAIICPKAKHAKKTRDILNKLYGNIIGSGAGTTRNEPKQSKEMEHEFEEMSLMAGVQKEFYAYVNFTFTWDVTGASRGL